MNTATFHPAYDPAREHAWHLSCWLAPDLHAWCVHDRSTGKLRALVAASGSDLPQPERLPAKPGSVSFTALPEVSTLVPRVALEAGTGIQHLKLVHGTVPTGLLRDEPIDTLGAHCIYLHGEPAELALLGRYPGGRSLPLLGTLVGHALGRSTNGPLAVLHRSHQRLDLVVADRGRLLLSNAFHATTAEDVLYFTLLAAEQCRLAPDTITVRAGGTHLTPTEEHLLGRYFVHGPVPSTAASDPALEGMELADAHHWTALIEQFACAS